MQKTGTDNLCSVMPYVQWILTACNECSNKEYGCSIRVFLV